MAYILPLVENDPLIEAIYANIEAESTKEKPRTYVGASSIGDDTLQKKAGRYVNPDGFTHGSAKQRMEWLRRGLKSGDMRMCNTFR